MSPDTQKPQHVAISKQLRVDLDQVLMSLKVAAVFDGIEVDPFTQRRSRERSIAITKLQEAIMWLGMDLKGLKEAGLSDEPNPYPSSYNPKTQVVEPTAQGLKL